MPDLNNALAKHEDGVHRDYRTRPIYPVPSEPDAESKCRACDAKVPGRPFTRMTRFIDVLDDKFSLEKWFQRQVLKGVVLKEHLILKASNSLNPSDPAKEKAALDDVCREAAEAAGAADAADMGTELHRTIEKVLRGQKVSIPQAFRADVTAVLQALADHKLNTTPDDLEVSIVIDGVRPQKTSAGIGGKFDLRVTMVEPCGQCGNSQRVADFKTGQMWYHGCDRKSPCGLDEDECPKRVMYGIDKFRMQLAGYASGKRIDPATGARFDLDVCQCWGYVIHAPATKGKCELFMADLERGRLGLTNALQVWQFRNSAGSLTPARPPDSATSTNAGPSGATTAGDGAAPGGPDIHGLIAVAADRDNLLGLRSHFMATGQWLLQHDEAAEKRVAELKGVKS